MTNTHERHPILLQAEGLAECDLLWWQDAHRKAAALMEAAQSAIANGATDASTIVDLRHAQDMQRVSYREATAAMQRLYEAKAATRAYRSEMGWADRRPRKYA